MALLLLMRARMGHKLLRVTALYTAAVIPGCGDTHNPRLIGNPDAHPVDVTIPVDATTDTPRPDAPTDACSNDAHSTDAKRGEQ
jgi:hypothetical protein